MQAFRSVAAALVALQIVLWGVALGLRGLVHLTGYGLLTTGDPRLYGGVAAIVVLPGAVFAGFAAVAAAREPTVRLVWTCALVASGMVFLWSVYEPWLGREPVWFRIVLPLAVVAGVAWSGRRALRRREAGEAGKESSEDVRGFAP